MKNWILIFFLSILSQSVLAQETLPDTVPVVTAPVPPPPQRIVPVLTAAQKQAIKDSIDIAAIMVEKPVKRTLNYQRLKEQLSKDPLLPFGKKAGKISMHEFQRDDKDAYFYVIAGLILFYGLIKLIFGKYVAWLFNVFFRSNLRPQQIKDQLQHTPLPSLLLNILFIFVGGVFLLFLSEYYNIATDENEWILIAYYCAIIAVLIIGQYILLKTIGWIFNISAITDIYIFIIFLVNKIIGILLLPVIVLMAFPIPALIPVVVTIISLIFLILLLYRFIISYKSIGNEIKVGRFHFFIYLCAFEIAPLLVIGKVLLDYVDRSY